MVTVMSAGNHAALLRPLRRTKNDPARPWRFRSRMAGVLCKPPFTEVVEKSRIRCQRSLQDFYQRREQDCSRPAAFKNATVRERPTPAGRTCAKLTFARAETDVQICNSATAHQSLPLQALVSKRRSYAIVPVRSHPDARSQ